MTTEERDRYRDLLGLSDHEYLDQLLGALEDNLGYPEFREPDPCHRENIERLKALRLAIAGWKDKDLGRMIRVMLTEDDRP